MTRQRPQYLPCQFAADGIKRKSGVKLLTQGSQFRFKFRITATQDMRHANLAQFFGLLRAAYHADYLYSGPFTQPPDHLAQCTASRRLDNRLSLFPPRDSN